MPQVGNEVVNDISIASPNWRQASLLAILFELFEIYIYHLSYCIVVWTSCCHWSSVHGVTPARRTTRITSHTLPSGLRRTQSPDERVQTACRPVPFLPKSCEYKAIRRWAIIGLQCSIDRYQFCFFTYQVSVNLSAIEGSDLIDQVATSTEHHSWRDGRIRSCRRKKASARSTFSR